MSTNIAAARWFDVLTSDAPREALFDWAPTPDQQSNSLDIPESHGENGLSPLQRATRIVDNCPPRLHGSEDFYSPADASTTFGESLAWQASGNISLLREEQVLFENFLHGISAWVCFSPLTRMCTATENNP